MSPPILCVLIDQQLESGMSWTDQAAPAPVTDDNANNGGWGPGVTSLPSSPVILRVKHF